MLLQDRESRLTRPPCLDANSAARHHHHHCRCGIIRQWVSEQFLNGTSAQYRLCSAILLQEAQLPQRNSASAAHMEGLGPPVHSPSPSGYTYAYGRIRNPQQTYMYVKRAVRKPHFKLNRAFKVIQGYPYLCRQEPRMVCCRNVQLIPTLFLKLTKIRQRENGKSVDFNDLTQVW